MKIGVTFLAFILLTNAVHAAESNIATITQIQGKTQIFVNPSKKPIQGKSIENNTMVYFEGSYYQIQNAKVGDKMNQGTILRTLPGAHANMIYDNGDQIHIGPGTAYRVEATGKKEAKVKIQLMYGRLRGIVTKEGPRQKLQIKTRTATMGVRGTDFFISDSGTNNETEVTVIRGAVSVKTEKTETIIKTGTSAIVAENTPVETHETTKEDLKNIETASSVNKNDSIDLMNIKILEKKAVEATLQDIKVYQPEIFEKLNADSKEPLNLQSLNTKTLNLVALTAPSAPLKKGKPRIDELNETEDKDIYEKYFKKGE